MANANSNRTRKGNSGRKSVRKRRAGPPSSADLNDVLNRFYDLLGRFSHALSFLECGIRLLDRRLEDSNAGLGDEAVCLRHGLDLFKAAYRDLDEGIVASRR